MPTRFFSHQIKRVWNVLDQKRKMQEEEKGEKEVRVLQELENAKMSPSFNPQTNKESNFDEKQKFQEKIEEAAKFSKVV